MLQLLFATVLALPALPASQDDGPKPPDPELVKETLATLKKGLGEKDPVERVRAIQSSASVLDSGVIQLIAKGLKDKEPTVHTAAVYALRFMDHPSALKSLHEFVKRGTKLHKEPEVYANLLKAIGQHGDASSIPILTDKLFTNPERKVIQARIYSLGNIRSKDAVEALLSAMKAGGRKNVNAYMDDVRLALMVLTGEDQGRSQDLWLKWWNNNKKSLEIAAQPPLLPQNFKRKWDYFWGAERTYGRDKKRRDRGNDPETDG